jgi:hypothetical protein
MRVWKIVAGSVLLVVGMALGVVLHSWMQARNASAKSTTPLSAFLFDKPTTTNELHAEFSALQTLQPADFRAGAATLVNRIVPDALPMAAALASTQFSGSQSSVLLDLIYPKWVKADAAAALNFAAGRHDEYRFSKVVDLCASQDVTVVEQWVKTNTDAQLDVKAVRSVAFRIAASDPEAAWKLADGITTQLDRDSVRQQIVMEWGNRDAPTAVKHIVALPQSIHSQTMFQFAFGSWMHSDSAAALKYLAEMPPGGYREFGVNQVASGSIKNPEALLSLIASVPTGDRRRQIHRNVAHAWATKDTTAALKWARALVDDIDKEAALDGVASYAIESDNLPLAAQIIEENPQRKFASHLAVELIGRWSPRDPAAAMAWSKRLPAGAVRNQAVPLSLLAIAKNDPATATKLCVENVSIPERQFTLPAYVRGWAQASPKAAADFVLRTTAGQEKAQLIRVIATAWAESDPKAVIEWAASLSIAGDREVADEAMLDAIAKSDPGAAAKLLSRMQFTSAVRVKASAAISNWTKLDPAACSKWSEELPVGELKDCAFHELGKTSVETGDIARAQTYAARIRNKTSAAVFRFEILRDFVDRDPKAATEWVIKEGQANFKYVETVAEHAQKEEAFNRGPYRSVQPNLSLWDPHTDALGLAMSRWAQQSPVEAAPFVAKLPPTEQRRGAYYVASSWAKLDPKAAADWIISQTSLRDHEILLKSVVKAWKKNVPALIAWTQSLPLGPERDLMLYDVSEELRYENPKLAVQMATGISDEQRRLRCLGIAAEQWARLNLPEFNTWMETNALPPLTKSELRRRANNTGRY